MEHIICIKSKRYVLDEVAIKFTKTFYDAVFNGKLICEAYEAAVNATTFNMDGRKNEVNLFTLLKASDYEDPFAHDKFGKEKHVCHSLQCNLLGKWRCLSEHNLIKQIPTRHKLKFRERETS